jgi:hypothetical protein
MSVNMPYSKLGLLFFKHWYAQPIALATGFTYVVWTLFTDLVIPEIGLQIMLAIAFFFDWLSGTYRAIRRHWQGTQRFDKYKFVDGTIVKPITLAFGGAIFTLMGNAAPGHILAWLEPAYFITYTIMECVSALANIGKVDVAKGLFANVKKSLPENWHFLLPKNGGWINRNHNDD